MMMMMMYDNRSVFLPTKASSSRLRHFASKIFSTFALFLFVDFASCRDVLVLSSVSPAPQL